VTGINPSGAGARESGFRRDDRMRLADLLRLILRETEARRLAAQFCGAEDLSEELLELMASTERICRHVHGPLQSGADTVLKRMQRRYRRPAL